MNNLRCIARFRDKYGKITGYRLSDSNGNVRDMGANELKKILGDGDAIVLNLSLTADNRLIPNVPSLKSTARKVEAPEDALYKSKPTMTYNKEDSEVPKILNFSENRVKLVGEKLVSILVEEYEENIPQCLIRRIGYKESEDQLYVEAFISIAAKRYIEDQTKLGSILKRSASNSMKPVLLTFSISENLSANEDDMGKYLISTPHKNWETDKFGGIQVTLEKEFNWLLDNEDYELVTSHNMHNTKEYESWDRAQRDFGLPREFDTLIMGDNIIYKCPKQTSSERLRIPDCITAIHENAFTDCTNIKLIVVDSIQQAKRVKAFLNRISLEDIRISLAN